LENEGRRDPPPAGCGDAQEILAPHEAEERSHHEQLGGEPLATLLAAAGEYDATANIFHTLTEAMTAFADEAAGLISAFHRPYSPGAENPGNRGLCIRADPREVNGNPPETEAVEPNLGNPSQRPQSRGFGPFIRTFHEPVTWAGVGPKSRMFGFGY
jgi:hypothetical protein